MEDEKKNNRAKVRLVQWLGFTGLFYMLICLALNYFFLVIKSINVKDTKDFFKFKISYLFISDSINWYMIMLIALVISLFAVLKLDTIYMVKHGNKNIKGKARFMELKEIEKVLYGFPENDIKSAEKSGIPLYRENGKIYIDAQTIHSLIIGTTRSGKGQTFVMPMIRYICNSQAKHSMVINDPKGEMLENCYDMLIDNGYDVVVLNLRDTLFSNLWNPLQIIIDEYRDRRNNKDGNDDLSRCIKLCESLADVFTHNDKSDPIWPESASSLFVAMLLYMLEQGYDNRNLEKVSLYSLYQMFIEFGTVNEVRVVNGAQRYINALDELFQSLPIGNPARSAYATSNFAEGDMRASIFSTLASNLRLFGSDIGVSKLTSGNQINFRALANPDKPMALFMLVPDNDTSRYVLTSSFVNQCYDELVEYANNFIGQKLPQRVHFILDEFGNMVHIPAMDTKITVGAGRNLLFDLFIQDLNQLDTKYGDAAKTIRSNCGNFVYINSNERDTNEYFSSVLGNKTIEYRTYSGDLNTWLSHQSGMVDSQPLISADELSVLPEGTAVTKRQRCYPMKTKFEYFYKLGIQPHSVSEIAKKMDLINRPLDETIYPLDEIWAKIIMRTSIGDGEYSNQEYHWKDSADKLLNSQRKWVWQVTKTTDNETTYRLVSQNTTAKSIKTNFAPQVVIVSEVNEILLKIQQKNLKDFNRINDYINQLHESSADDKEKIAKRAIMAVRRQLYLSLNEQKILERHINTLHNGKAA